MAMAMVLSSSLPSRSCTADATTPRSSLSKPPPPVVDRAIIVGGGLGGLSAALQLRRAGIDAQVYIHRFVSGVIISFYLVIKMTIYKPFTSNLLAALESTAQSFSVLW